MSKARIIDIENDAYHAMRDVWSHSQLEVLAESPELFRGRFIATPPLYERKRTKDLDWGTVADTALTNPGGIDAVMRIIPAGVLNADGHRKGAPWLKFQQDNEGLILLKASETEEIVRAVQNTWAHPLARRILEAAGDFQRTIVWTDDETGLCLRSRLDRVAYLTEGLVVADFKTTRSEQPRRFAADAYEFGYGRQAAMYWDAMVELGEEPDAWINVAIGKPDPQTVIVYEMSAEAIALGRQENRRLLRELAGRLKRNDWTQRDRHQALKLDAPKWALRELQQEASDEHSYYEV